MQRRFQPSALLDFSDGRDALAACLATPPDLLIADLYLRDMDGRDIVRALREHGLSTKVVILTAHPEAQLPAELVSLGVAGFVGKNSTLRRSPVNPPYLEPEPACSPNVNKKWCAWWRAASSPRKSPINLASALAPWKNIAPGFWLNSIYTTSQR